MSAKPMAAWKDRYFKTSNNRMAELMIEANIEWMEEDMPFSSCSICDDDIYGKGYSPVVFIGNTHDEIGIRLCKYCYQNESE